MPMNGYGLFGKPIGTGAVFNGQFDDEPYAQQPMQKQGGGFFGEGGAGRGIAGTIGDYLLQMSGARPIYAPAMQQKRAMDYQQKLFQQQRQAGLEDYGAKLRMKAAYETPEGPNIGTFEDNAGNMWRYNKDSGELIGDQPMFVDPNERVYFNNGAMVRIPNQFSQNNQGSAIPPQAAAELRANPQSAAQFDEIFGAGAAASILGQ